MAPQSERRRGKRAYEREEHLHFWEDGHREYPMPPLFDLHEQLDMLRKQMEEALQEAIEDANAARQHYKATHGELRSLQGEGYRYTFRLHVFWEPRDETPVQIQIDPHDPEQIIKGTIIETDGAVLHLATKRNSKRLVKLIKLAIRPTAKVMKFLNLASIALLREAWLLVATQRYPVHLRRLL